MIVRVRHSMDCPNKSSIARSNYGYLQQRRTIIAVINISKKKLVDLALV